MLPLGGGTPEDVTDDLEFLAAAGQVAAPEGETTVAMFWDFGPLDAARQ